MEFALLLNEDFQKKSSLNLVVSVVLLYKGRGEMGREVTPVKSSQRFSENVRSFGFPGFHRGFVSTTPAWKCF